MKKLQIILAILTITVTCFVYFGFLGYFGVRMVRRTYERLEARAAFAAEDWKTAEKLLKEYLEKDPDSEDDCVRLAQVYRHFGNTDAEMHCWYRASALNPLKWEYWSKYTACAMNSRNFAHLYTTLARKIHSNVEPASKDKMLYLICAIMTEHVEDAEEYYEFMISADPGVFQRDEIGRYADFLVTYKTHTPEERSELLERFFESDDPVVRLESSLFYLGTLKFSEEDPDFIFEEIETTLKQAVALNRFAGTPLLASFYFSCYRFRSVIEVAEPYLEEIEHLPLTILYAESCVYGMQPEKLIPLTEHFRSLGRKYRTQVTYFEALYDFSQGGAENNDDLTRHMQELGAAAQTDLANLINLQVALNNDNVEKILSSLERIMLSPPFYDLQERARIAVRHYLGSKVEDAPEFAKDPRVAKIAVLISGPGRTDPFLMHIIIADQQRRNVLNRQTIQEYLALFPSDVYLLQVAAEFELFNGKPERCLEYAEQYFAMDRKDEDETSSNAFAFLHMLALELMGRIDEATKEYTALVEKSEMDLGILYRYFRFCIEHERRAELAKMAERMIESGLPDLKALAPFFQAEELLLQDKKAEALALLETVQTDLPDFALRAANVFSTYDQLDQALSRYLVLLSQYSDKRLIMANIAEVYAAKGMKSEALSYARQAWEQNQDDRLGQYVYAKMLAAIGRYQDAEKVLRIPYRELDMPSEVKDLWTEIMLHCVREDLANHHVSNALDRANHYLLCFPEDHTFKELKARALEEFNNDPRLSRVEFDADMFAEDDDETLSQDQDTEE